MGVNRAVRWLAVLAIAVGGFVGQAVSQDNGPSAEDIAARLRERGIEVSPEQVEQGRKIMEDLRNGVEVDPERIGVIGHSLGGLFLAKYLSENIFPKKIGGLFLVAAPHSRTKDIGNFELKDDLEKVWEQCQNIHLYQSEDDLVVPASEAEEYKKAWPKAKLHIFPDRGHFNQENFPELVEEIKERDD